MWPEVWWVSRLEISNKSNSSWSSSLIDDWIGCCLYCCWFNVLAMVLHRCDASLGIAHDFSAYWATIYLDRSPKLVRAAKLSQRMKIIIVKSIRISIVLRELLCIARNECDRPKATLGVFVCVEFNLAAYLWREVIKIGMIDCKQFLSTCSQSIPFEICLSDLMLCEQPKAIGKSLLAKLLCR